MSAQDDLSGDEFGNGSEENEDFGDEAADEVEKIQVL